MFPAVNVDRDLFPVRMPYTWRGAPVYCIRYTTSSTLADGTTIYTFREPATILPSTNVVYRIIHVVGWLQIGAVNKVWCGQTFNITTATKGFHINASGQLRFRGGAVDPLAGQVYIYYARCRQ